MTNTPIIDKAKQENGFNINNSNWRIAHLPKLATKEIQGQRIFTLKPATNLFHCRRKMQMISQNTVPQTSTNSKNSHQKVNQISVPLKIILKISHQLQYLQTVTMLVSQRMVVKFSL